MSDLKESIVFQEDAFPRTEPGVHEMLNITCQIQCLEINISERVNKTEVLSLGYALLWFTQYM